MIALLGLFAGFVSAFFGIGGGILLVPLLPLILDISAHQTVGLSLLMICFSAGFNTLYFSLSRRVEWPLVLRLIPSVIVGGFIGGFLGAHVSDYVLRCSVFVLLVGMSLRFLRSSMKFGEPSNPGSGDQKTVINKKKSTIGCFKLSAGGILSGSLSGFSGAGTGVALNFIMLQFNLVDIKKHSPSVNALMIFVAFGGITSFVYKSPFYFLELHQVVGTLNFFLGGLGIMAGSFIGKMIHNLDFHRYRLTFLVILTFSLAIKVLFEVI